jgi:site-specific DNA-methyltransferase (adenine-specific)
MQEANGKVAHPNQKPLGLMAWCIRRSGCPAGGTILDPYAGSGSTLVAAKKAGFRAIGIELKEQHAEIAANRLAQTVLPLPDPEPERAATPTFDTLALTD